MLKDKTLKSIPIVEMVRCEITGNLFPASECEVVVIKIIKSKNTDINSYNPFSQAKREVTTTGYVQDVNVKIPETTIKTATAVDTSSPEFNKIMQKRLSAIPPSMKDLFKKPPEIL